MTPQKRLVDNYFQFVDVLCSFSYEIGREACRDKLLRSIIFEMDILEPMCIIAWEMGYDDEKGNVS